MTNTPNYNLSIAEGTDTVNLLTQCYPNFETIDTAMKENKDAGVGTATETKTGTNHSVIRNNTDGAVFAFTATSNYVAGDTFTVDAQAVTVTTPDGQSLPSGAFVINKSVLCRLDGTVLTVFTGGGSTDAETLGGELPSFYAKQSDMDVVENDVNILNSNLTDNYYTKNEIDAKSFSPELDWDNMEDVQFVGADYTPTKNGIFIYEGSVTSNWGYFALRDKVSNLLIGFGAHGITGGNICINANVTAGRTVTIAGSSVNPVRVKFIPYK